MPPGSARVVPELLRADVGSLVPPREPSLEHRGKRRSSVGPKRKDPCLLPGPSPRDWCSRTKTGAFASAPRFHLGSRQAVHPAAHSLASVSWMSRPSLLAAPRLPTSCPSGAGRARGADVPSAAQEWFSRCPCRDPSSPPKSIGFGTPLSPARRSHRHECRLHELPHRRRLAMPHRHHGTKTGFSVTRLRQRSGYNNGKSASGVKPREARPPIGRYSPRSSSFRSR